MKYATIIPQYFCFLFAVTFNTSHKQTIYQLVRYQNPMMGVTGNFDLRTFFVVTRQRYKMKKTICVLHQKKFFMRIIKKPFLINMPLFSIVRIDHNKFVFPLLASVWRLGTHGANGKHTWCGGLTPFVRIAYSYANNVGFLKQKGLLRRYSVIIS